MSDRYGTRWEHAYTDPLSGEIADILARSERTGATPVDTVDALTRLIDDTAQRRRTQGFY